MPQLGVETALALVGGLGLLVAGAELLVRGAARMAAAFGISPLVIGLTVVAYGTSSPELVVSLDASLSGRADIALGNVVGSNVFNVLVILGLSAVVTPLAVANQLVRLDVPLLVGVSFFTWFLCLDGSVGRVEGGVLVAGVVAYSLVQLRVGRRAGTSAGPGAAAPRGARNLAGHLVLVGMGLAMLALGARWLVSGAVTVAEALGVSELVIGLTLVAAGTSLPEVATSVIAALRGERDIAVGNVLGSNVFNLLGVLGVAALLAPEGIAVGAPVLSFDLPVMVGTAVVCLPVLLSGRCVSRLEGALLLASYAGYVAWQVLAASGRIDEHRLAAALGFAAPLMLATGLPYLMSRSPRPPLPRPRARAGDRPFRILAAGVLGSSLVLVGACALLQGWRGVVALTASAGSLFLSKLAIFTGALEGHPHGPWGLALIGWFIDVYWALALLTGLQWTARLPMIGGYLVRARQRASLTANEYPGIRRMAFSGVALFVLLPIPATGAVAGTLLGSIVGLSRTACLLAVGLGSALSGMLYAGVSTVIGARWREIVANPLTSLVCLAVLVLFSYAAWRRIKRELRRAA